MPPPPLARVTRMRPKQVMPSTMSSGPQSVPGAALAAATAKAAGVTPTPVPASTMLPDSVSVYGVSMSERAGDRALDADVGGLVEGGKLRRIGEAEVGMELHRGPQRRARAVELEVDEAAGIERAAEHVQLVDRGPPDQRGAGREGRRRA